MNLRLIILTVGLSLGAFLAAQADDAVSTRQLIGTWVSDPASTRNPFVTIVTYNTDGTGAESLHLRDQPESTSIRLTTRWSVKDSVLSLRSITSSDPQKIPVGLELKDHIISLTEDKFVFEAEEGYGSGKGTQESRVRQK